MKPRLTEVFNLSTGKKVCYTLPPTQAVAAAWFQYTQKNWNTWSYDWEQAPVVYGVYTVACGDWCCVKEQQHPTWKVRELIEILKKCDEDDLVAWSIVTEDDARAKFPRLDAGQIKAVMNEAIERAALEDPMLYILDDAHYEIIGRPPE